MLSKDMKYKDIPLMYKHRIISLYNKTNNNYSLDISILENNDYNLILKELSFIGSRNHELNIQGCEEKIENLKKFIKDPYNMEMIKNILKEMKIVVKQMESKIDIYKNGGNDMIEILKELLQKMTDKYLKNK
ncbi:hypothetical protein SLOPH_1027 [Spraguea lophii 42_110]|uniref:Uncharacterized protein n=1 Tax=Spraguea lophii (strain 42_110) TaxID=1358809 RepID=S7XLR7_SPRLO|nr:hypothetical protein SLOPH_1027 [Spraguea lophii 42_110]